MLTPAGPARVPVRTDRAAYRPFRATVLRTHRLCPSFLRVTLGGPDLDLFGTDGFDQRVKVVFPLGDGALAHLDDPGAIEEGTWQERWRALPGGYRSASRTYTVRRVRPWDRELDIDLVVRGDRRPATSSLAGAAAGDEVLLVGPDARSIHSATGIDFRPREARRVLLAGDETAAPAIAAILESLPAGRRAHAFVEVPDPDDRLPLVLADGADITWLPRSGGQVGGHLVPAVTAWAESSTDALDETFYAWLAGEAGVIRHLRRELVTTHGLDRSQVAFAGYWRLDRSGAR